jgi:hypothetical protein
MLFPDNWLPGPVMRIPDLSARRLQKKKDDCEMAIAIIGAIFAFLPSL